MRRLLQLAHSVLDDYADFRVTKDLWRVCVWNSSYYFRITVRQGADMSTEGTVKWFDDKKGYGFIEMEGSSEDAFVHHSDIQMQGYATLKEGQRVSFELTQTEKGTRATNVTPLDAADSGQKEPSPFSEGF